MDRIFFNNIQKEAIEDEIKSFINYELDGKDEKDYWTYYGRNSWALLDTENPYYIENLKIE